VRRELAQSKSFTAADCFPVGRERLPIPTEVSFSRDLWKAETGKISYVEVVAMNGAGRDGGRGGAGRGAGKAALVQKQQVPTQVVHLQSQVPPPTNLDCYGGGGGLQPAAGQQGGFPMMQLGFQLDTNQQGALPMM
jgi:hypothetical protein